MTNWTHPLMDGLPRLGPDIEVRSFEIIKTAVSGDNYNPRDFPVIRRMIHATADLEFGQTVRVHPDAMERGMNAIRSDRPIIVDVHMLQAGITRADNEIICKIRDSVVAQKAKTDGSTRAAAAMDLLADRLHGAVVAIGNAPTALWKLLELYETRGIEPAVVIGLPVGFVGAAESKQALLESDLCYITNVGPRGGSPVAASAVNAIVIESRKAHQ